MKAPPILERLRCREAGRFFVPEGFHSMDRHVMVVAAKEAEEEEDDEHAAASSNRTITRKYLKPRRRRWMVWLLRWKRPSGERKIHGSTKECRRGSTSHQNLNDTSSSTSWDDTTPPPDSPQESEENSFEIGLTALDKLVGPHEIIQDLNQEKPSDRTSAAPGLSFESSEAPTPDFQYRIRRTVLEQQEREIIRLRPLVFFRKISRSFHKSRNGRQGMVPLSDYKADDSDDDTSSDRYYKHYRPEQWDNDQRSHAFSVSTEHTSTTSAVKAVSSSGVECSVIMTPTTTDGSESCSLSDFFDQASSKGSSAGIQTATQYSTGIALNSIAAEDALSVGSFLGVSFEEDYPQLVLQDSNEMVDGKGPREEAPSDLLQAETSHTLSSEDDIVLNELALGARFPHPARKEALLKEAAQRRKEELACKLVDAFINNVEGHTTTDTRSKSVAERVEDMIDRDWDSASSDFYVDTEVSSIIPEPADIETKSTNWENDEVTWSFSQDSAISFSGVIAEPKKAFTPVLSGSGWGSNSDDRPFDEPELSYSTASFFCVSKERVPAPRRALRTITTGRKFDVL